METSTTSPACSIITLLSKGRCLCVDVSTWPICTLLPLGHGRLQKECFSFSLQPKQNFCRRSFFNTTCKYQYFGNTYFFWLCRRVIGHCFLIFGSAEESYIFEYIYLIIYILLCMCICVFKLLNQYSEKYFYINNYHTHICKVYTGLLLQKELIK